jgi:hypothetical protein
MQNIGMTGKKKKFIFDKKIPNIYFFWEKFFLAKLLFFCGKT